MAKVINPTKVITGVKTRWRYANVWQAKSINGGTPKYSVSLIIPKSDTKAVTAVKNCITERQTALLCEAAHWRESVRWRIHYLHGTESLEKVGTD